MSKPDPPKNSPAPVAKSTGWNRPHSEIVATVCKAEAGDKAALSEVKEMLTRPGTADMLGGNLAREALRILVQRYVGSNSVARESITRKLEELRVELSGENPTAIEKLLIERIVATWLHLHHLEVVYAGKDNLSLELASYYQRSISAAQKRYLAAIKGLAEVRKLALPVLQVNVARKQVNVAAGTVVGGTVNN